MVDMSLVGPIVVYGMICLGCVGLVAAPGIKSMLDDRKKTARQRSRRFSTVENFGNRLAKLVHRFLEGTPYWVKKVPMKKSGTYWIHVSGPGGHEGLTENLLSIDLHGFGSGEFGLYNQDGTRVSYDLTDEGMYKLNAEVESRLKMILNPSTTSA